MLSFRFILRKQSLSKTSFQRYQSLNLRFIVTKSADYDGQNASIENCGDRFLLKSLPLAPSLEEVKSESLGLHTTSNDTIIRLAVKGNNFACTELLKRHIMLVDGVGYNDACEKFDEIGAQNKKFKYLAIPNKVGVVCSTTAAVVSFPLCFYEPLVHWFNEKFVTADVPEPKDLETWLEVGAWAWNWMEPVMGQLSFFLLCLAFAKAQFQTLGIMPFSESIKEKRALLLSEKFPGYDPDVLALFSKSQPFEWDMVTKFRDIYLR